MTDIQEDTTNIDTFNVEKTGKLIGASFLSRTTEDTTQMTIGAN